jgi:hypothetical protein
VGPVEAIYNVVTTPDIMVCRYKIKVSLMCCSSRYLRRVFRIDHGEQETLSEIGKVATDGRKER